MTERNVQEDIFEPIGSKDVMSSLFERALMRPCRGSQRKNGQPMVAVVNSWMELSPGDAHLKETAEEGGC